MYFDTWDILEAYALMEYDWNVNGILRERKSNIRRNMSTGYQLWRMGVKFAPSFDYRYENLSDNGKAIYDNLLVRYGLNEVK